MGGAGDNIETTQVIEYRPMTVEHFPLTPDSPSQATSGQSPYNVDSIRQFTIGSPYSHSPRPLHPQRSPEIISALSSPDSAPLRQHLAVPRHRPNALDSPWLRYYGHSGALSTSTIGEVRLLRLIICYRIILLWT
jgi:hypothetical protein